MSENDTGDVTYTPDLAHPAHLTEEQKQRLLAMRDEEIDFSDTPSQAGQPGRRVGGARFGFETIVLDKDVQDFFRHEGVVSSERVNAVLREYAEAHRKTA